MKQLNIDRLTASRKIFFDYVGRCNKNFRSLTPSIYLYQKIFEKHQSAEHGLERLISDCNFLELIYVTLVSWNMNMRGAKMVDFKIFASSIQKHKKELIDLENIRLELLTEKEADELLVSIKSLFVSLRVMKSKSKIVGVSKTLHFLLPKLFPPIDRKYTMSFFYNHQNYFNDKNKDFESFSILMREFHQISQKMKLSQEDVDLCGWNTSVPKLIDNAIIGFESPKNGLAK